MDVDGEQVAFLWLDDKLVEEADAKVSVFDHGLLYGDGVFEGIRVYDHRIFEEAAHIDRLYESAHAIRLTMPMNKAQLTEAMRETVKANDVSNGYIRLVVSRGVGTLGLNPFVCKHPMVIIIASNIQLYPEELYEKGMKVISASVVRNHPLALSPQVKSLNYLNNILAKIDKRLAMAGTDKSKLLTATVYVSDISLKAEMNEVWTAWLDPANKPTRACIAVGLDGGADVEIMVSAAK